MKRTNMADETEIEGFLCDDKFKFGIHIHRKENGPEKYSIINAPEIHLLGSMAESYLSNILAKEIKKVAKPENKKEIMVFGLGNVNITSDALGPFTVKKIFASKGLDFEKNVSCFIPGVYAKTGLETYDVVRALVDYVNPDLLIFIDTLATSEIKRLSISFQLSNVGIVPGGGVNSFNKEISQKTVGVQCLTIGVPLLIYADNFLLPGQKKDALSTLILTPKDIDEYVNRAASVISKAVNNVFTPELNEDEIESLLR